MIYIILDTQKIFSIIPPNSFMMIKVISQGWCTITHNHLCHIINSTTSAKRLTSLLHSTPETNIAKINITTHFHLPIDTSTQKNTFRSVIHDWLWKDPKCPHQQKMSQCVIKYCINMVNGKYFHSQLRFLYLDRWKLKVRKRQTNAGYLRMSRPEQFWNACFFSH